MRVTRLDSFDDVVRACGDDVYARSTVDPRRPTHGWAADGAVVWVTASRRSAWLTGIGAAASVARLVGAVDAVPDGVTLTADAVPLLPARLQPVETGHWEWLWTADVVAPLPGEDRVRWLDAADDELLALLEADSPTYSARPGGEFVRRWCGVRDDAGGLVACAAEVEYVPGVPQLASIVTRADRRGSGLGAAVTAWLTRRLLEEGAPTVTLGMYSDNDVARGMYTRLGYRVAHRFTSGRMPGRLRAGEPVQTHTA